jgi:glycosyltransferase involved in cell wall biosynthesis
MAEPIVEGDGKLKIFLALATSTGGVGRHVVSLAAGFIGLGQLVVVAAPPQVESQFGFSAVARFVPVDIGSGPRPWHDARAAWRLRRLTTRADVLHAHGIRAGAVVALSLLGRRRGRPALVVSWHNAAFGAAGRLRLTSVVERQVARRADLVLGVSDDLVEHLRTLSDTPVDRAVVSAPSTHAVHTPSEVRASLGLSDGVPLVLAVGRLHAQKGFDVLIAAAALLPSGIVGPLVAIAGEGPARPELEAAIRSSGATVRLLGHRDDIADLLGAADVIVMPSRWEGWPLAAVEALRAGRPFVATAVGGLPDLVADAAILVAPDDPGELAAAIVHVLGDAALAGQLSAAAVRRSRELPTDAEVTKATLDVYRRVVADRPRQATPRWRRR